MKGVLAVFNIGKKARSHTTEGGGFSLGQTVFLSFVSNDQGKILRLMNDSLSHIPDREYYWVIPLLASYIFPIGNKVGPAN